MPSKDRIIVNTREESVNLLSSQIPRKTEPAITIAICKPIPEKYNQGLG